MKTQHLFDEYNDYIDNQEQSILNLTKQKRELEAKNKSDQSKYKELIACGEDEKADELFTVIAEDDNKLKAINKRLNTKKEVSQEVRDKKTIELLKHQKDLPHLYANEKAELLEELKDAMNQYNSVIEKIEAVNDDFADEHARFVDVYQSEDIFKKTQNDKSIRGELINNFREILYSDFISTGELPFIHNKKMEIKGEK
ncbi:pathogenicity island protein [Staphylococcus caeli]|uniref:pathogenicity island protein n=1 Tax=Staphylococcus caeli TaxID=2201815 RepID=UPI003F566C64